MIPKVQARRGLLRKLLFGTAIFSYLLSGVSAGLAVWLRAEAPDDVVGSFVASIVFFAGVGVVLHVLANASLPDLRVKR